LKDLIPPRLTYPLPWPGPWVSPHIKTKLPISEYPAWVDRTCSIQASMLWNLSELNLLLDHRYFHLPIANWKCSARQGLTEELISTSYLTQISFLQVDLKHHFGIICSGYDNRHRCYFLFRKDEYGVYELKDLSASDISVST
jgi:hypothetical protein